MPPVLGPIGVAALAAGATVFVALVDPNQPGHYPICPSLYLTGFYCPGCGTLRAWHDLAHLDVVGAWGMNPAFLVALPYLLFTWGAWLRRAATGRPRSYLAPPWVLWTVFVAVIAYWVARNIPVLQPWLAP